MIIPETANTLRQILLAVAYWGQGASCYLGMYSLKRCCKTLCVWVWWDRRCPVGLLSTIFVVILSSFWRTRRWMWLIL